MLSHNFLASAILALLLSFSPVIASAQTAATTYGQLADQELKGSWAQLQNDIGALNENMLPHEAKTLRKVVGRLRDMIDIFSYALPSRVDADFFVELRASLDLGYEQLGFFKDLYDSQGIENPADAQYDDKEVKNLLKPVLSWKQDFFKTKFQARLQNYLNAISADNVGKIKKKDQSKFYWKQVKGEPQFDDTAVESLQILIAGLLQQARTEEKITLKIDDLLHSEDIEIFHDFRKRVRAVVEICEYFPELLITSEQAAAQLSLMDELVSRYGDLHDSIIAYEKAVEKDQKKKARALKQQIEADWISIKEWQKDQSLLTF